MSDLSDISFVSTLTKLETLSLYSNSIVDITSISYLTNLKELILSDNNIRDLKPLENCTNLTYLDLQNNCIYNTSTYKDESDNEVSYDNLDIIADLKLNHSLTKVYLSGNGGITDWTPVSSISGWNSTNCSGW